MSYTQYNIYNALKMIENLELFFSTLNIQYTPTPEIAFILIFYLNIKIHVSMYLIKYHAMKTYGGVEI